jgi:hypothetical protein
MAGWPAGISRADMIIIYYYSNVNAISWVQYPEKEGQAQRFLDLDDVK